MIKVLLLDTNISSYPIYNYLKSLNFDVHVVGSNKNDFLAKTCENYFCLDYSKHEFLLEYVRKMQFSFIIPGCNDISYLAVAKLTESYNVYGVDNFQTSLNLFNKRLFKDIAVELNINVPRVYDLSENNYGENIIIKPVDSFSGKGITVVKKKLDRSELNSYIELAQKYSSNGDVLVEDYIEGDLYSHSAFLKNGKISNDFIIREFCNVYKYAVDLSWLDKQFQNSLLLKIRYWIEELVKKLNLVDGLIHTQVIVKENDVWILEITRRCPGDLYSRLIELSTSFSYNEAYTNNFINQEKSNQFLTIFANSIIRQTVATSDNIFFKGLSFDSKICIKEVYPITNVGTYLNNKNFTKVAIMFFEYDNFELNHFDAVKNSKYFNFI